MSPPASPDRAHRDAAGPGRADPGTPAAREVSVHTTVAGFRRALAQVRRGGERVGLVPTMGYLHEGHASLVEAAVSAGDTAAVTIFVNPLQFGAGEDLASYPRDLDRDLAIAAQAGARHVFCPDAAEMYPRPVRTIVSVRGVAEHLEGASRPGHFDGVATVVAKLLAIAGPCRAYFGEKDFQQLAVVRTMAEDLSLPAEIVACATVREPDGLALSSRNVYLGPAERAAAPVLHRALIAGRDAVAAGERDPEAVRRVMCDVVAAEPLAALDYAEVVDAATFTTPDPLAGELRLVIAARLGRARLIDNVGVAVR